VNEEQRQEIMRAWYHAVARYPQYYLYHRVQNFMTLLRSRPFQQIDAINIMTDPRFGTMFQGWFMQQLLYLLLRMRDLFMIAFLLPIILGSALCGFMARDQEEGLILFILNAVSITLLAVLFFFSMASVMRYVYIVVCFTYASFPFAYRVLRNNRVAASDGIRNIKEQLNYCAK
jgi:hypothetical protein